MIASPQPIKMAWTSWGQDQLVEGQAGKARTANQSIRCACWNVTSMWLSSMRSARMLSCSAQAVICCLITAIQSLPSTVCSSRVPTCNFNFQQLAKDKKLNPNQWEVHLIECEFCEDTRPDPQLQNVKAQHSMLIANLNRQGYREVKLHVILVGVMGTIYKYYTDKPLADLNLDYHKIEKLIRKLMNTPSDMHLHSYKQGMHCNITQATTVKDWV